jgi:CBS domain containing-hemolysin-like protein
MTSSDAWLLFAVVVLLLVSAVLVGTETAIARLSASQVEEMRREGDRHAGSLARLIADRPRFINALLLTRTALLVLATALALVLALRFTGTAPAVVGTVLMMSALTFIVVGVGAQTLGKQHAYRIAAAMDRPTRLLGALLSPLTRLLILLGNAFTPGKGYPEGPFASQAELRELVDQAGDADLIEDDERQMIHSVFELGDTIVREVMVPRTDMVFIERGKSLRQAVSLGLRSGYSRMPVIGANADDVLGVVYLKDVTKRVFEHHLAETTETVESVMREPYFVPDSKRVDALLREMQAARVHIAIVVDEFGGTAGLVTIEDILEEIVGEIADEYDTTAPEVEPLASGGWRISARLPVEDLAELAGMELAEEAEHVETVGGLLARRLGKVPIPGARVAEQGWELIAESAEGRRHRIGTVLCRPLAVATDADSEPEAAHGQR